MPARTLKAVEWIDAGGGALRLLDQRLLPGREVWLHIHSAEAAAQAIREMVVRGAPAIGITAAYAMALAAMEAEKAGAPEATRRAQLERARELLAATRPTAVNLFWALDACKVQLSKDPAAAALLKLARRIHADDVAGNERIGELGLRHLQALGGAPFGVLTHCNAGALATGGLGTALAPLFLAHERGLPLHVYVDETRPRLQGARLTAWELEKAGVPHTLICDGAAASLMARGKIQLAITGADRIAANGDAANKIGTYSVAVNAAHHRLPFLVAAPASTFDLACPDGRAIPIEERAPAEVTDWGDERTCPPRTTALNPAFDVTPAALIRAILTDRGEISPVNAERVKAVIAAAGA
ncbi:MAG TPA: S-methyl-5-thioribose-1-phosphate isomerase [Myxococcaceae bacterium]|nr:S-methyl-5-thioribose-1-phosphate isomerase [Myxococcaceae bacterium]